MELEFLTVLKFDAFVNTPTFNYYVERIITGEPLPTSVGAHSPPMGILTDLQEARNVAIMPRATPVAFTNSNTPRKQRKIAESPRASANLSHSLNTHAQAQAHFLQAPVARAPFTLASSPAGSLSDDMSEVSSSTYSSRTVSPQHAAAATHVFQHTHSSLRSSPLSIISEAPSEVSYASSRGSSMSFSSSSVTPSPVQQQQTRADHFECFQQLQHAQQQQCRAARPVLSRVLAAPAAMDSRHNFSLAPVEEARAMNFEHNFAVNAVNEHHALELGIDRDFTLEPIREESSTRSRASSASSMYAPPPAAPVVYPCTLPQQAAFPPQAMYQPSQQAPVGMGAGVSLQQQYRQQQQQQASAALVHAAYASQQMAAAAAAAQPLMFAPLQVRPLFYDYEFVVRFCD